MSSPKKRGEGTSCHHCKKRIRPNEMLKCTRGEIVPTNSRKRKRPCVKKYCMHCIKTFYSKQYLDDNSSGSFICPACREECRCAACRRRKMKQKLKTDGSALENEADGQANSILESQTPDAKNIEEGQVNGLLEILECRPDVQDIIRRGMAMDFADDNAKILYVGHLIDQALTRPDIVALYYASSYGRANNCRIKTEPNADDVELDEASVADVDVAATAAAAAPSAAQHSRSAQELNLPPETSIHGDLSATDNVSNNYVHRVSNRKRRSHHIDESQTPTTTNRKSGRKHRKKRHHHHQQQAQPQPQHQSHAQQPILATPLYLNLNQNHNAIPHPHIAESGVNSHQLQPPTAVKQEPSASAALSTTSHRKSGEHPMALNRMPTATQPQPATISLSGGNPILSLTTGFMNFPPPVTNVNSRKNDNNNLPPLNLPCNAKMPCIPLSANLVHSAHSNSLPMHHEHEQQQAHSRRNNNISSESNAQSSSSNSESEDDQNSVRMVENGGKMHHRNGKRKDGGKEHESSTQNENEEHEEEEEEGDTETVNHNDAIFPMKVPVMAPVIGGPTLASM